MNKAHVANQQLLKGFKYFFIFSNQSTREAEKKLEARTGDDHYPKLWIAKGKKSLRNVLHVTLKWVQHEKCPLLYLAFAKNAGEPEYASVLHLLKDMDLSVRLKLFFVVNDGSPLSFLFELYNKDYDIFDLELSFAKPVRGKSLQLLRNIVGICRERDVTTDIRVYSESLEGYNFLKELVTNSPSPRSSVKMGIDCNVIPSDILATVKEVALDTALTLDSFEFFPNQLKLFVRSKHLRSVEGVLLRLGQPENLGILSIGRFSKEEAIGLLSRVIEHFPNLHEVTIQKQQLRNVGPEGKRLHDVFLAKGMSKHLKKLISNRVTGRYNRGKIMVLGEGGAGKTATLRSLSGKRFNKKHDKTIVADKISIVDTDGQHFQSVGENTDGFAVDLASLASQLLFADDMARDDTAEKVNLPSLSPSDVLRKGLIAHQAKSVEDVTKPRRRLRTFSNSKGLLKCIPRNIQARQYELNARKVYLSNLDELGNCVRHSWWDFGGQRVFDALHPLYLTPTGLFIVVFRLDRLISDQSKTIQHLRRWLSSLSLYSEKASVFLVGTRAEGRAVIGKYAIANEAIKEVQADFDALNFMYNHKAKLRFFPVENSLENNHYLEALKIRLSQCVEDDTTTSTWNAEVELSWMFFMHHVYSNEANVFSFTDFEREALLAGFTSEEADKMINFFSSAGEILDFRHLIKDPNSASIVMKPRWLLKILGTMITCRESSSAQQNLEAIAAECTEGCKALLRLLIKRGILGSLLLSRLLEKSHQITPSEYSFIVRVSEAMLLIARFGELPNGLGLEEHHFVNSPVFWVVPSFFTQEEDESNRENSKRALNVVQTRRVFGEVQGTKSIVWAPKAPFGLFEKFVCSIVNNGRRLLGNTFVVETLSGSELTCSFKDIAFRILFQTPSSYKLLLYSSDTSFLKLVKNIVTAAYNSVHILGLNQSVGSRDCEFNVDHRAVRTGSPLEVSQPVWDVFLSHCWKNGTHARVIGIAQDLKRCGINTWLDEEQMRDDINLGMLQGILNSHVFVAFITKAYLEGSNNRESNTGKEFNFAAGLGVSNIIPVVLDPELLDPSSWNNSLVKLHLPGALYIDFSSRERIQSNLPRLVERIKMLREAELS